MRGIENEIESVYPSVPKDTIISIPTTIAISKTRWILCNYNGSRRFVEELDLGVDEHLHYDI